MILVHQASAYFLLRIVEFLHKTETLKQEEIRAKRAHDLITRSAAYARGLNARPLTIRSARRVSFAAMLAAAESRAPPKVRDVPEARKRLSEWIEERERAARARLARKAVRRRGRWPHEGLCCPSRNLENVTASRQLGDFFLVVRLARRGAHSSPRSIRELVACLRYFLRETRFLDFVPTTLVPPRNWGCCE